MEKSPKEIEKVIQQARADLFAARENRLRPLRDDKIITSWNGLMISAFARAGLILDAPEYTQAARTATDFVLQHLHDAGAEPCSGDFAAARRATPVTWMITRTC